MFKRLSHCVKGDRVEFANVHSGEVWIVHEVRDLKERPLHPTTYRLRPENVRSRYYAVLRNEESGRLRTEYFAENIRMKPARVMPTIALVGAIMGLSGLAGYALT